MGSDELREAGLSQKALPPVLEAFILLLTGHLLSDHASKHLLNL